MKIRKSLLLSTIICCTLTTYSQIVNIESARMQSDTTGWMGGAGAGLTIAENVNRIFILNADVHLQYKSQKDLWLILGSSNFLKAAKENFVNNSFIHFRYNRKLNPWLRWEAFTQWQNNQLTQIDSRFLIGTGPRFKILSKPVIKLYAASLVMFEREKERTHPVIKHENFRSSSYVSFTIIPTPTMELISTTFYQPLFKDYSDYRILNQASLKMKATNHLSVSLRWNYLYDRKPAGTAPKTTYNFGSGIEYHF